MCLFYPLNQKLQVRHPLNHAGSIIGRLYIPVKSMYTRWPISHLYNSIVKKHLSMFVQGLSFNLTSPRKLLSMWTETCLTLF